MADQKTNVMRILEQKNIPFQFYTFPVKGEPPSGSEMARSLGFEPERVFKTLVTVGKSGQNYVFMIPVDEALDLKKAATAAKEKSIEMIKSKDLLKTTGYIHGGCSPIGMKKAFPTFIDETAVLFDDIIFSAGKIGAQVEVSPKHLEDLIGLTFVDLTV